ncbi:hypothetical protein BH11GEM1_BH11GEM1_10580 [soil metagenome]
MQPRDALTNRVKAALASITAVEERRMFGGITFREAPVLLRMRTLRASEPGEKPPVVSAVLVAAAKVRPAHGAIFHSERGSEYMGAPFCTTVARLGMQQSANASGPGDNAHAESFFHSLKAELTRGVTFLTERRCAWS